MDSCGDSESSGKLPRGVQREACLVTSKAGWGTKRMCEAWDIMHIFIFLASEQRTVAFKVTYIR